MTKRFYQPTAQAQVVRLFAPREAREQWGESSEVFPAVEYLDYGIIGGIQITSLSKTPLSVTNIQVNTDFRPTLCVDRTGMRGKEIFQELIYPVRITYGGSFFAITHAPIAKDWVKKRCYGDSITVITVSTDLV